MPACRADPVLPGLAPGDLRANLPAGVPHARQNVNYEDVTPNCFSAFKPTYYTDTGSLKELTVTSSALSPDSLGSLDRATGSITDALREQAAREATAAKDKAAKQDELNQLDRDGDILEQELRIQELREKLPLSFGDD